MIIRPDQSEVMFNTAETILGLKSGVDAKQHTDTNVIPLGDVYSAAIEKAARVAYFHDYRKFGFQNWKPKN